MAKLSLISIAAPPAAVVDSSEFISSPHKQHKKKQQQHKDWLRRIHSSSFWLYLLITFACVSMLKSAFFWNPGIGLSMRNPCKNYRELSRFSRHRTEQSSIALPPPLVIPLRPHELSNNMSEAERELWAQPNDLGYRPCLEFSNEYMDSSPAIAQEKRRFLIVVVNGGLNQQRNQIVDAVLIARVLEAALVVPVLQVNQIWGDESEFLDIFDVDHFKRILSDDVKIVSSLPASHVWMRPRIETNIPMRVSPEWIRAKYSRKLRRDGLLLLRGIDSKLTNDLPPDLQKLRCKVAFHALRFAPRLQHLGERLAKRMWKQGPYVALHLRLERDVWVRTGCLPGIGPKFDEEIRMARISHPQLLTSRSNKTAEQRRNEGLCPLGAHEVASILVALGANRGTRIFWAGGEPLGGSVTLDPLRREFSRFFDKFAIAEPGELDPYVDKASSLAAIDYIIALNSDVFMPSHGGNMGHALRGHRAYVGHRKYITPQKRGLIPIFGNLSTDSVLSEESKAAIRDLHSEANGRPQARTERPNRDVLGYPAPDCMCRGVFDLKLKRMIHRY